MELKQIFKNSFHSIPAQELEKIKIIIKMRLKTVVSLSLSRNIKDI